MPAERLSDADLLLPVALTDKLGVKALRDERASGRCQGRRRVA